MVGLFIVTDASRVGMTHWWLFPVLLLTLLFGPAGLLLYLGMRKLPISHFWTALAGALRRCVAFVWPAARHSTRLALHPPSTTKNGTLTISASLSDAFDVDFCRLAVGANLI